MDFGKSFFSEVESAIIEQYKRLKVKGDVDNSVIAGFILFDSKNNEIIPISIGTGTKLMSGDQRNKCSKYGPCFVHDCHAEILARRALQCYLWESEIGENMTLHFYTSTPPCGDCCVHETKSGVSVETGSKPFDWTQEQLFTSPPNIVRGKPGRGSRSLSVSCSDKITEWIHCGVCGSLLSTRFKDLKITTICVGDGNAESCERAFFRRLGKEPSVKILVGKSSWVSKTGSPSASSFAWYKGMDSGELIAAKFGRKFGVIEKQQMNPKYFSIFCDAKMMERYCRYYKKNKLKLSEIKEEQTEYNKKKDIIKEILIKYGGKWAPKLNDEKEWILDPA